MTEFWLTLVLVGLTAMSAVGLGFWMGWDVATTRAKGKIWDAQHAERQAKLSLELLKIQGGR